MGYTYRTSNSASNAGGTTQAVTLAGVVAGDLLLVGANMMTGVTCSGVASTSPALTFTKLVATLSNPNGAESSIWAGVAPSSADYTLTATWSGTGGQGSVLAAAYSGGPSSLTGIVDWIGSIAWSISGATGSRLYLPNRCNTYVGQLAFTLLGWPDGGGSASATLSASAPYTVRQIQPDGTVYAAGAILDGIPSSVVNLDVVANASVSIAGPVVLTVLLNDDAVPSTWPKVVQHKVVAPTSSTASAVTGTLTTAPVDGNLLVAVLESRAGATASRAGWAVERSGTDGTGACGLTVLTRTASGETTAGYTFTMSGAGYNGISLFEISNHGGVDSSVAPTFAAATTSTETPALNPTVDNCLLIAGFGKASGAGLAIGTAGLPVLNNGMSSPAAPWSEYADLANTTATTRGRIASAACHQTTHASQTCIAPWSSTTSAVAGGLLIAIKPAVSVTTSTRTATVTAALDTPGRTRTAVVTAALGVSAARTATVTAAVGTASVESTRTAVVTAAVGTSAARAASVSAAVGTSATRAGAVTAALGTSATRTASVSAALGTTSPRTATVTAALSTPGRTRTATVTAALDVAGASARTATVTAALGLVSQSRTAAATAALGSSAARTGSVSGALGLAGLARTASVTGALGTTATRTAAVTAALATAAGIPTATVISRGLAAGRYKTNRGTASDAFSTDYANASWSGALTAWVAVDLIDTAAATRAHVALAIRNRFAVDFFGDTTSGIPKDYTIQTSGDSTTGLDGTWATAATVTGNVMAARLHALDLTAYAAATHCWVKLVVTANNGGSGTSAVLDAYALAGDGGAHDAWLILGDSITAAGAFPYDEAASAAWADGPLWTKTLGIEGREAIALDGGNGGQGVAFFNTNHAAILAAYPGDYVGVALGTNDADGTQGWIDTLLVLVDSIVAVGKTPAVATLPWRDGTDDAGAHAASANIRAQVWDAVRSSGGHTKTVLRGPDLDLFFDAHTSVMSGIHPTSGTGTHYSDGTYNYCGYEWWQRLWALAIQTIHTAASTTASSARTATVTAALATPGASRTAAVSAALGLVGSTRVAGVSGALGTTATRTATVTAALGLVPSRQAAVSAALATPGMTRTAAVTAALGVTGAALRTAVVTAALATPGQTRQASVSAALGTSAARTASVAAAVGVSGARTAATTAAVGLVGQTRSASVTAALAVAGAALRTATVTAALATPGVVRTASVSAALALVGSTRTAAVFAALGLPGAPGRLVLLDRAGVTLALLDRPVVTLLLERMDAMTTYDVGDVAELQVTLSALGVDGSYAAADADVLVLLVQGPAGAVASYTLAGADVLKRSTGIYYFRLPLDADGVWRYVWQATGAVVGSEPGRLRVRAPAVVGP